MYCVPKDVTDAFGRVKSSGLDATEYEALISQWSAYVDGFLQVKYNPLPLDPIPELIRRIVAQFVMIDIMERVQNPPPWLKDRFESLQHILEQIASGDLLLPGVTVRTDMGRIQCFTKGFEPPFARVPSLDERFDPDLRDYERTRRKL